MGGSQSSFDYDAQLLSSQANPRSVERTGPEWEEKGFGRPRINLAANDHGMTTVVSHLTDESKVSATIWECFLTGRGYNPDAPFLCTRKFKVDPNFRKPEEEKTEEKKESKQEVGETKEVPATAAATKKKREPSGYIERDDGSIKRFDYVNDTYEEVYNLSTSLGRGFKACGAKAGDTVGIFAVNRAEWIISALGVYSQSMRIVPLYATLGPDSVQYIIEHATIKTIVISRENIGAVKKVAEKVKGILTHIVVIDSLSSGKYGNVYDTLSESDVNFFADYDISVLSMNKLIEDNRDNEIEFPVVTPKPEDGAFIMYTSGTTGVPKGVAVSHQNVISVAGSIKYLIRLNPHDTYFSYLPLAHIFETVAQSVVWSIGGKIYFSQGDIRQIVDDLRTAQPMIMCGVPRIFSRFFSSITGTVEKSWFFKRWYFNRSLNGQCELLRDGRDMDTSWDSNVFAKVRDTIGLNNIKYIVSGAAPCPPYLIEFMRVLIGPKAYFVQGYGMTECCAGSCVVEPSDRRCGHVGPPLASNMLKLADIPEMKYSSNDPHPRGEILIHGPSVFEGYYKNQEATDEAFHVDPQGRKWLRTGDVGRWNPDGTLSVIDRKKNIIKLQQGEYVAIEMVEDTYGRSNVISQIWCYGNSYKTMVVAIVVVSPTVLYDFAVSKGFWNASTLAAPKPGSISQEFMKAYHDLITGPNAQAVKDFVSKQLKEQEGTLQGFEKVKAFHLEPVIDVLGQGFNEENDCLTPTMKKKRVVLLERYLPILKDLYTGLKEPPRDGERW